MKKLFLILVLLCTISAAYAVAPVVDSVNISTISGENKSNEDIDMVYATSDGDLDTVYTNFDWRVDGTSMALINLPFEPDGLNNLTDYSSYGRTFYALDVNANITFVPGAKGQGMSRSFLTGERVVLGNDSDYFPATQTVSAWIYPTFTGTSYVLAQNSVTGQTPIILGTIGNKAIFGNNIGGNRYAIGTTGLNINTWYLLTGTYNGSHYKIYVDGNLEGTYYEPSRPASNGCDLSIGVIGIGCIDPVSSGNRFQGHIDEFMMFDRELSQEQIEIMYSLNDTPLARQETEVGSTYTVVATPNDGTQDGTPVTSNSLLVVDSSAPIISNFQVYGVTQVAANISWDMDENANASITVNGITQTSATYTSSKNFEFTGLQDYTNYAYSYTVCDVLNNCDSGSGSFMTSAYPPTEEDVVLGKIFSIIDATTGPMVLWGLILFLGGLSSLGLLHYLTKTN